MSVLLCTGQPCGAPPRSLEGRGTACPGLRLCRSCCRTVRADLLDLPALYEDCESAMVPRRNPTQQRVSGTRQASGILLDERVLSTRSGVLGLLCSWSALVADERAVARPVRRDPAGLAAFLINHLNWLLAHPAAADFAEEVAQVARRARSAHSQPAPEMELGECVHPDCGAPMTATCRAGDGRGTREVRCTAGHSWQPHQWLQLARQIQQTGGRRIPGWAGRPDGSA